MNEDVTLIPQLRMMLSINKNQKDTLRQYIEQHPDWDPLFRHDVLHLCLTLESMPERVEQDTDYSYHLKILELRRRLDYQNRANSCLLHTIEKLIRKHE